jgi:hypothetical protein
MHTQFCAKLALAGNRTAKYVVNGKNTREQVPVIGHNGALEALIKEYGPV